VAGTCPPGDWNAFAAENLVEDGRADRGLLVAGIGLSALMNLLGRVEPDMAIRYLDVTLTDLKREFQLALKAEACDASA